MGIMVQAAQAKRRHPPHKKRATLGTGTSHRLLQRIFQRPAVWNECPVRVVARL